MNWESMQTPLFAVISVFLILGAGAFLRKIRFLEKEADASLMKMVVNFLMPCLMFSNLITNKAFQDSSNLVYPPIAGFLLVALGILFCWTFARLLPKKWTTLDTPQKLGTFALCTGLMNYGYVPIPLVQVLFPGGNAHELNPTLGVLFVHNAGTELALWTVGIFVLIGKFNLKSLRSIFNIPNATIILALTLNLTGLGYRIPDLLIDPIRRIGTAAIPISLLFAGASLFDHFSLKRIFTAPVAFLKLTFFGSFLRLFLLPVLIICLAVCLPCSQELKQVLVVQAAMSSAVFPIILSSFYGGSTETAIDVIITNSLISLVTTPLWIAIGLHSIASV